MDHTLVEFTSAEVKAYTDKFNMLTNEQPDPVSGRVRHSQKLDVIEALQTFAKLKVPDDQIEMIWRLMDVDSKHISLYQFMIGLRLCSAVLKGKAVSVETLYSGEV